MAFSTLNSSWAVTQNELSGGGEALGNASLLSICTEALGKGEKMKIGTVKTSKVIFTILAIFVLFYAFALLPEIVQGMNAVNTVTATITVGNEPDGVAFASNGVYAYITHYTNGSVSVVNTATDTVTASIAVGNSASHPGDAAVTPNDKYVYVTNSGSNSVSVISTAANTVDCDYTCRKLSSWRGYNTRRQIRLRGE